MAGKRRLNVPDAPATTRRTLKEITKAPEKKYNSSKRSVRAKATTAETDRAIAIIERATKMRTAKNIYSSRWAEYERAFKLMEEERPDDEKWRANLPDTFQYASVRTAEAAFIDSEVTPIFSKNQDEDLMRTSDMRDLYTDNARKGDQKFQLYLVRKDALKLGTGFLYVYHQKDRRIQWQIDRFDPESDGIIYTRKEVDVFSDPKTERVSPYLVLVDEQARADFRGTARDAILIEIIPRAEAKMRWAYLLGGDEAFDQRVPTTQALRTIATAEINNRGVATTANDNKRDTRAHTYTFFAPVEIANDMVEVLHYFCVRPEDSEELVINGQPIQVKTPTQPSPLPYIHKEIPLVPVRFSLYSGDEFWGAGVLEISSADAKASQQHREMMNDRQRISLFSPVFSDVTDEIDQKFLKLKPLSIIRTRGGVPHQYKIPGITSADIQLGQDHQASIKRSTGIDENLLGGGGTGSGLHRYTATAIAFIRQTAFMRLKDFQFLYSQALIDEVRLKLKLFEQYYSSPVSQAPHLKNQPGLSELALKAKEFAVKTGDVYTRKKVSSTLFTGPIEDIQIDMEALVPLTNAELITKWSQVIRDVTPFVQAGVVDLDMQKILAEYLNALDVNMAKFQKEPDSQAISMADGEHELLSNKNTSRPIFEKILKDGTPPQYLSAAHLKRHQQLLANDSEIGEEEMRNLIAHIAKDTENYTKKMQDQAQQGGGNMDTLGNHPGLGSIGSPDAGGGGQRPPSVSMNYKDAPEDVRRQIEQEAGFDPSKEPPPPAATKPAPKVVAKGTGQGVRQPQAQRDQPLLNDNQGIDF